MIVGAATNPAAVTTVWKVLGRRTLVVYLLTVGLSALVCGLLLNGLSAALVGWLPQLEGCTAAACVEHQMGQPGTWSNLWAVVLLAVLLGSKLPIGGKKVEPADAPAPLPEAKHACDCGCSDEPLHQLTKK